jgi:DNA processing protein
VAVRGRLVGLRHHDPRGCHQPGYIAVYNLLFGIAVFVMLIFFCLQLITGLIRRDPTALTRAALGLAKSVLGSFVVITLTALLLEVVDQLCIGIVQAAGRPPSRWATRSPSSPQDWSASTSPPPVSARSSRSSWPASRSPPPRSCGSPSSSGKRCCWSRRVRAARVQRASWDASRGWIGKWAMFVVALICSKLVLVVMFLVAITQVSAPIDADLASVSDPIAGIVLMAMAAFAPYLTYKFIAFVGFDMYHAIGSEQDAKSALNRPIPVPTKPQGGGDPKKVLDGPAVAAGTRRRRWWRK